MPHLHRHLLGLAVSLALVIVCWGAWHAMQGALAGTWLEELGVVAGVVAIFAVLSIADAVEQRVS